MISIHVTNMNEVLTSSQMQDVIYTSTLRTEDSLRKNCDEYKRIQLYRGIIHFPAENRYAPNSKVIVPLFIVLVASTNSDGNRRGGLRLIYDRSNKKRIAKSRKNSDVHKRALKCISHNRLWNSRSGKLVRSCSRNVPRGRWTILASSLLTPNLFVPLH